MALNELLAAFTTEADQVAGAKTALQSAQAAAAEAQAAVVSAQGMVNTEKQEALVAMAALLDAINAYANELGLS